MSACVIAREFGVVVVDEAVSDAADVMRLLDEAVTMMRAQGQHALAFHMGSLIDARTGAQAIELANYFASIGPADARIVIVHYRDTYMEELANIGVGVLQQHGFQAIALPSPVEAEAWLRETAPSKK